METCRGGLILQDLTVVVVTHAGRWHLIEGCMAAALFEGVKRVVVVANGVHADVLERLVLVQAANPDRVILEILEENSGSAGGFSAGLQVAYTFTDSPVLLLDDDNWLEPGSVERLLKRDRDNSSETTPRMLLAFRPVNTAHSSMIFEGAPSPIRVPGSAGGLDIPSWVRMKLKKPNLTEVAAGLGTPARHPLFLESATYGGLFLPMSVTRWGELPLASLILYGDDIELTERLVSLGAQIELCPEISLPDVEMTATLDSSGVSDESRMKYHFRNMVYLDKKFAARSGARIRFFANYLGFLAHIIKWGFSNRRPRFAISLLSASSQGLSGKLGKKWPL